MAPAKRTVALCIAAKAMWSASSAPMRVVTYATDLTAGDGLQKNLDQLGKTLSGANADVACLQGVYVDLDSTHVKDYPYVYQLPKKEGTCKCSAQEVGAIAGAVMPCMSGTCAASADMVSCLMGPKCGGPIIASGQISDACIGCVGSQLNAAAGRRLAAHDGGGGMNIAGLVTACTATSEDPPMDDTTSCPGPYEGHYGVAVVSKYPFSATKAHPFPNSVVANRGVAHVNVDSCGAPVDLMCGWWRGNSTILGRFGFDYFPPQAANDPKSFYGSVPKTPSEEAMLQAKSTADYVGKSVPTDSVAMVLGNFAVGPDIASAKIGGVSPTVFAEHTKLLTAAGFANPMVDAGAAAECSDCMNDMMAQMMKNDKNSTMQMYAAWNNVSTDNLTEQQVLTAWDDLLIDHAFIRKSAATTGVKAFRSPVPTTDAVARYPMGIAFDPMPSVTACTKPTTTTPAAEADTPADGDSSTGADATSGARAASWWYCSVAVLAALVQAL